MKFIYRFANGIRKIYQYIFRPETSGVKCLIECDGQYLFIKHSYGNTMWNIPGGGLKKNEDKVSAVKREVFEELGLSLAAADFLGEYVSTLEYHKDTVYCFYSATEGQVLQLSPEIQEAQWFDKNNLPEGVSHSIKRCLGFMESSGPQSL